MAPRQLCTRLFRFARIGFMVGLVCVNVAGCASCRIQFDPLETALDMLFSDDKFDDYKDRGYDDKTARQKAYEDEFFEEMEKDHDDWR